MTKTTSRLIPRHKDTVSRLLETRHIIIYPLCFRYCSFRMYIILSVFERSQTVVDEINESYFHCCVDILWVKNKRNDPPLPRGTRCANFGPSSILHAHAVLLTATKFGTVIHHWKEDLQEVDHLLYCPYLYAYMVWPIIERPDSAW